MNHFLDRVPVWTLQLLVVLVAGVTWQAWHWGTAWWFWWWLGLGLGLVIVWLDELAGYRYTQRWLEILKPVLVTRSLVVVAVLGILGFFLLTSSGSLLGAALVWSWLAAVAVEFWRWRASPEFVSRFLWQLKTDRWQAEHQIWLVRAVVIVTSGLLLISWL